MRVESNQFGAKGGRPDGAARGHLPPPTNDAHRKCRPAATGGGAPRRRRPSGGPGGGALAGVVRRHSHGGGGGGRLLGGVCKTASDVGAALRTGRPTATGQPPPPPPPPAVVSGAAGGAEAGAPHAEATEAAAARDRGPGAHVSGGMRVPRSLLGPGDTQNFGNLSISGRTRVSSVTVQRGGAGAL